MMKLMQLSKKGDDRGSLVIVEQGKSILIKIKRVYYMLDTLEDVRWGSHAHKKSTQVVIPIAGSCCFLLDDGVNVGNVLLDPPIIGLLIELVVWYEMYDYNESCVSMVLTDDFYDESDYIHSYGEFKLRVSNEA